MTTSPRYYVINHCYLGADRYSSENVDKSQVEIHTQPLDAQLRQASIVNGVVHSQLGEYATLAQAQKAVHEDFFAIQGLREGAHKPFLEVGAENAVVTYKIGKREPVGIEFVRQLAIEQAVQDITPIMTAREIKGLTDQYEATLNANGMTMGELKQELTTLMLDYKKELDNQLALGSQQQSSPAAAMR